MSDFTYDIECYPNFFSLVAYHEYKSPELKNDKLFEFEISEWKDDSFKLLCFLRGLEHYGHRMVGFNNADYDYMLIHYFLEYNGKLTYQELYAKSQAYFVDGKNQQFNPHAIPDWNHLIPQVDLFRIHHFDNAAKRTSLKIIEFNMRSSDIKDLPFDPLKKLTYNESRELLRYNYHDTKETHKFKKHSQPMIDFRDKLSHEHGLNFTNFSDPKIGSEFFTMELKKHGINRKLMDGSFNQTFRDEVILSECILPYIKFEQPEFNRILDFFNSSVIDEYDGSGLLALKGFFKNITCSIDGFDFDFGAGGIHGSLKKTIIRSSDTHDLLDWDVASFYPNLAIKNRFYPEHLTERFCDIYLDVYEQRKSYKKKTPENAMLKLALNSVYGNSSSIFSMMLDQKFTLSITINGQLLLCMLAEEIMKIPDSKMIQINTDGLSFLCPKEHRERANKIWKQWEKLTKLELEEAEYDAMYIRDVNNYMAKYKSGGVKRIGCYAHELAMNNPATRELAWHKNQSAVVIAKAAEAALIHDTPIPEFIHRHTDYFDFMLRTKVPRSSRLELRTNKLGIEIREPLQNVSRYYASKKGGNLIKIMPHTQTQLDNWKNGDHYQHKNTGEYQVVKSGGKPRSGMYEPVIRAGDIPPQRDIGIDVGTLVEDCSSMKKFKVENLDLSYYIKETRKIVDPLVLGV